jgi:hypothetical protein
LTMSQWLGVVEDIITKSVRKNKSQNGLL